MIKKLQMKLIILTMSALLAVLFVIITGINIINYRIVVQEADKLLAILAENDGTFPEFSKNPPEGEYANDSNIDAGIPPIDNLGPMEERDPGQAPDNYSSEFPPEMSLETPYETRYFSVVLNKTTEAVVLVETGRIASVDSEDAIGYAKELITEDKEKGFIHNFRFLKHSEKENTRIIFLDCGRRLDSVWNFLFISTGMSCIGFAIVTLIIIFFSNRMVRPVLEMHEKQKRFITNAGHEIKTPLTIINADTDVLEMEFGENEWTSDIQKQTKRLTQLTNNLILLTRMEESENTVVKVEFPISDVINEAALSFQALAQMQNKSLELQIEPMLSICGDSKAIHQLITLLLDNAVKYSPEGSNILLSLEQKNKIIHLVVSNRTLNPLPLENLNLLFERFYRADSSRNSMTGGYGIGLSVAKAIVNAHNGKIKAVCEDGKHLQIVVTLPV